MMVVEGVPEKYGGGGGGERLVVEGEENLTRKTAAYYNEGVFIHGSFWQEKLSFFYFTPAERIISNIYYEELFGELK